MAITSGSIFFRGEAMNLFTKFQTRLPMEDFSCVLHYGLPLGYSDRAWAYPSRLIGLCNIHPPDGQA